MLAVLLFFSYFSTNTYVVDTQWKLLGKAIPMSTTIGPDKSKYQVNIFLFLHKNMWVLIRSASSRYF